MTFIQLPVPPLPPETTAKGKTIVITGASSGLGFETARQVLRLGAATVVLAVRNTVKGEARKASLLADPAIRQANNSPNILVMSLDMGNYASVRAFSEALRAKLPALHILVLNAGIAVSKYARSPTGHERSVQVNYLSNTLLIAKLLPLLDATAGETEVASRITWVGRRKQTMSSLEKNRPVPPARKVLDHLDNKKNFKRTQRYRDSKLLCTIFMHKLAPRLDNRRVVLNMVYPGNVNTELTEHLPRIQRWTIHAIKFVRARKVEEGTRLILHAMLVAGFESHGKFLQDRERIP
ncbi:MAG: hypothetical protein L6R42_001490 [Xanthoria sp. 1 TBL-2021]|nr:MAG: hypothetical protein L6R42_001490 [Xanthoria sp. 1 TBL-2021]